MSTYAPEDECSVRLTGVRERLYAAVHLAPGEVQDVDCGGGGDGPARGTLRLNVSVRRGWLPAGTFGGFLKRYAEVRRDITNRSADVVARGFDGGCRWRG
ncbi:MAG TPA: hypothetical protein VGB66_15305 [Longimicrobium sp.]